MHVIFATLVRIVIALMHFDEEMRVKLHNLISETQVIIKVKTMLIADFMVRCMGERYSKELQKLF